MLTQVFTELLKPHKLGNDFVNLENELASLMQSDNFLDPERVNSQDCKLVEIPRENRLHPMEPAVLIAS